MNQEVYARHLAKAMRDVRKSKEGRRRWRSYDVQSRFTTMLMLGCTHMERETGEHREDLFRQLQGIMQTEDETDVLKAVLAQVWIMVQGALPTDAGHRKQSMR